MDETSRGCPSWVIPPTTCMVNSSIPFACGMLVSLGEVWIASKNCDGEETSRARDHLISRPQVSECPGVREPG